MSIAAIPPVDMIASQMIDRLVITNAPAAATTQPSFADIISQGIDATATKLAEADRLLARAAIDDSIPLHQVTYALEQARVSFELMIQVRNRLVEASQQMMNMQL